MENRSEAATKGGGQSSEVQLEGNNNAESIITPSSKLLTALLPPSTIRYAARVGNSICVQGIASQLYI